MTYFRILGTVIPWTLAVILLIRGDARVLAHSSTFFLSALPAGARSSVPATRPTKRPYSEAADIREALRKQLYDVTFLDPEHGWAVGGAGTTLRTMDGGRTWRRRQVGGRNIHSVAFVSERDGWAVGERGLLLHTRTGGNAWGVQKLTTKSDLSRIRFANPRVGWIVGDRGIILSTRDGGRSWQRQRSGLSTSKLQDIACLSPHACVIVGDVGTVLTTHDGGGTWTKRVNPLSEPPAETIYSVTISRNRIVWAVGGWRNAGSLLRSDDEGKSWTEVRRSDDLALPLALFFWDSRRGIVGHDGVTLTNDGGTTWTEGEMPEPLIVRAFFFVDEHLGWAVGDFKTILHTTDGGRTWVVRHTELQSLQP